MVDTEAKIMGKEAAWKVGSDRILTLHICEDGYDYVLMDENCNKIDGGPLRNPDMSMIEVRSAILESFGLECRDLRATIYEDVMEQMMDNIRLAIEKALPYLHTSTNGIESEIDRDDVVDAKGSKVNNAKEV